MYANDIVIYVHAQTKEQAASKLSDNDKCKQMA